MTTKKSGYLSGITVLLLATLFACAPTSTPAPEREMQGQAPDQIKAAAASSSSVATAFSEPKISAATSLPVRFQSPSYVLSESEEASVSFGMDEDFVVKVGADISSSQGAVVLRDIMKKLAALKKMNVSWASDVDQFSLVDVDIRANDDFFKAIDNLLRQRDYFHEVQANTIVVQYKETRKFHLAMPFMKSTYSSTVGANVSDTSSMSIESSDNDFDVWQSVQANLDQVLNIWQEPATAEQPEQETDNKKDAAKTKSKAPAVASRPQSAKGFYTIDMPIGLITVTAPRRIINKVEDYLDSLKKELYRMVVIEAKIIEVTVTNEREVGIDWNDLLNSSPLDFTMQFGSSSMSQPLGDSTDRSFTIGAKSFTTLISALEKQGTTRVLANPRISVLNGQPAIINVGKDVTYINKVTTTVDEGVVSTNVTTANTTSGIVMSVVPVILSDNEIILNLTPVTSQLEEPIIYRDFGDATVGLPVVNVRELTTMVRMNTGEMLVVGGLIDSSDDGQDESVPLLSKVPVLGKLLFSLENKIKSKRELVILLKPEII